MADAVVLAKILRYKQYLETYNPLTTDENKVLHVLHKFTRLPMTIKILQETGVGKCVNKLRKVSGTIGDTCREIIATWKQLASDHVHKSDQTEPSVVTATSTASSGRGVNDGLAKIVVKTEKVDDVPPPSVNIRVKVEKVDGSSNVSNVHEKDDQQKRTDRSNDKTEDKNVKNHKTHRDHRKQNDRHASKTGSESISDHKQQKNDSKERNHEAIMSTDCAKTLNNDDKLHRKNHDGERSRKSGEKRDREGLLDRVDTEIARKRHKHKESSPEKHHSGHKDKGCDKEADGRHHRKHKRHKQGKDVLMGVGKDGNVNTASIEDNCSEINSNNSESTHDVDAYVLSMDESHSNLDTRHKEIMSGWGDQPAAATNGEEGSSIAGKVEKARKRHTEKIMEKTSGEMSQEETPENDGNNGLSFDDFLNYDAAKITSRLKKKKVVTNPMPKSDTSRVDPPGSKGEKWNKDRADNKGEKRKKDKGDKRQKDEENSKHKHGHKRTAHASNEKASSKKRKKEEKTEESTAKKFEVPLPQKQMTHQEILDTLPEINPTYRPLPHLRPPSPKQKSVNAEISLKTYSRTQVYAGKRQNTLAAVPKLYDACMRVLIDNIDRLDFVGGVPYDILKPVLERCTSKQLYGLEECNPQFIGETNELWEQLCKRDFRSSQPDEFESWRELYLRRHDERDAKLKNLTANISASMAERVKPVRKTQLAFVDSVAKPPREVRRSQLRHGTAGPSKPRPRGAKAPPLACAQPQRAKVVKRVAPMMAKSLRLLKKCRR